MIRFLNYEGKKLPVRLSYFAMAQLQAEQGAKYNIENLTDDYSVYESLLFYSLESGYMYQKKPMPYTRDQMCEILEECFFEFLSYIPEFLSTQKVNKEQIKENQEVVGEPKKEIKRRPGSA
ncbi:MAG: hypothetical protein WCX48_12100 [Bacteroidales bacterium]|jgi:hypothetical protein